MAVRQHPPCLTCVVECERQVEGLKLEGFKLEVRQMFSQPDRQIDGFELCAVELLLTEEPCAKR